MPDPNPSAPQPPTERQQIMALLRFLGIILLGVLAAALTMAVVLTLFR
jgi:hypothetical protein